MIKSQDLSQVTKNKRKARATHTLKKHPLNRTCFDFSETRNFLPASGGEHTGQRLAYPVPKICTESNKNQTSNVHTYVALEVIACDRDVTPPFILSRASDSRTKATSSAWRRLCCPVMWVATADAISGNRILNYATQVRECSHDWHTISATTIFMASGHLTPAIPLVRYDMWIAFESYVWVSQHMKLLVVLQLWSLHN